MIDLTIYESGNGGELQLLKNDLAQTDSFFNMVYLALFGGNVEASTTGNEIETELRLDWWGNALLFADNAELQFNSDTERTLNNITINSEGRNTIESAVKKDLLFLSNFAACDVIVSLETVDRVSIYVTLQEPDNIEEKNYQFIWDASKSELIESIIL